MSRYKLTDKKSSPPLPFHSPFLPDSPPLSVPGHGWKGMINLSAAPLLLVIQDSPCLLFPPGSVTLSLLAFTLHFLPSTSRLSPSLVLSVSSSFPLSVLCSPHHFYSRALVGRTRQLFLAHFYYMHMTEGMHFKETVFRVS